MTTLAQIILEKADYNDDVSYSMTEYVSHRLLQKTLPQELIHPDVDRLAYQWRPCERFVFPKGTGADTVRDLIEDRMVDFKIPFMTARMPSGVTWIEWTSGQDEERAEMRMGAMLETQNKGTITVSAFTSLPEEDVAIPFMLFECREPPFRADPGGDDPIVGAKMRWMNARLHPGHKKMYLKFLIEEIMMCLFLITTPRVCDMKTINPANPKQTKARAKRGKPPLLECKQVVLRIGIGGTRYMRANGGPALTESEKEAHRKRLHQVMGHFRTYTKRQETPKVVWVPPHMRGDASLGILIHERLVKK